jgi:hypothetical protein
MFLYVSTRIALYHLLHYTNGEIGSEINPLISEHTEGGGRCEWLQILAFPSSAHLPTTETALVSYGTLAQGPSVKLLELQLLPSSSCR